MTRIHETISGQRIEYDDPEPKLARFLARVEALERDPKATEDDMIALVYGKENPILEQGMFPERGAVTKRVLEHPVYSVLMDLLFRKRLAETKTPVEKVAARYTLTVADAAAELGVTDEAVRRMIRERKLPAWKREGAYHIDPKTLATVGVVGRRGPLPKDAKPLEFRTGYDPHAKASLRLKAPGRDPDPDDARIHKGGVQRWRRVGVLSAWKGNLRFFELEPGDEWDEVKAGDLSVSGKFKIVRKVNNARDARQAWLDFQAV